ncbi:MAG: glutamate formimidoyltransferase [Deltaproteobacteria bacterium]|nr:glutamate formimidoyltransferase [Deltaproteobacteria bacterium]
MCTDDEITTSPLVECVPNVSEGKNKRNIEWMADTIQNTDGVTLLHVDSNADANRTVYTFAGNLQSVSNAAFALFEVVNKTVDMRTQKGAHVRNGGMDVCPLIPVGNVTTEECVVEAKALGRRIGEMGVPVYLYGAAATSRPRQELSWLRKGQYEALEAKLRHREWQPDFGPTEWTPQVARSGSVQIGVRPFLIALNVNLKTKDVNVAKNIARKIRSSGFGGQKGEFPWLKADGWWMAGYDCAQVTMNFTNHHETPVHIVYERIRELACQTGTDVDGAELIGLIPLSAILTAGLYYAAQSGRIDQLSEKELIALAIHQLGLQSRHSFEPTERIFEKRLDSSRK